MAIDEIHQHDIGTKFKVQVRDQDDAVVPLASGDVLTYLFSKPDASVVNKTPHFVTNGADGWIQYVTTASGDLDQAGLWRLQVYVNLVSPSGTWHSDIGTFRVWPNL